MPLHGDSLPQDDSAIDIGMKTDEVRKRERLDELSLQAEKAMAEKEWWKAMELLQTLLALDPANANAESNLGLAREEELRRLFTEGHKYHEAGNCRKALASLRQVKVITAGAEYENAQALIASARSEISVEYDSELTEIVASLTEEYVIPFLGAGVNFCGRPEKLCYCRRKYLPSAKELAEYLVVGTSYPETDPRDLSRVSQYIDVMRGSSTLYRKLRKKFDVDYEPTEAHRFFATLTSTLKKKGYSQPPQLIMTTNYDDLMEKSFEKAEAPFEVVYYMAEGPWKGKCILRSNNENDGECIKDPNTYYGLAMEERSVIFKVHGAVHRQKELLDSYVITEDDYIDYLIVPSLNNIFPAQIMERIRESHFLFLGYGLRDWNLRVILSSIWNTERLAKRSWAIQVHPSSFDKTYWQRQGVGIIDLDLADFIAILRERLSALSPQEIRE
jgi:tetratricopeptide (TPR) repeat protein